MQAEKLARENQALRERLSRLSEASLRINESLDVETVLQGVLDSARALTDARYGVITLLDDAGEPQAFLASGMTPEQARKVWEVPGGLQFFEALRGLRESVRVRDLQGHLRSLGLPEFRLPVPGNPVMSLLGAPVRHGGESVSHIYLAQKEGAAEFTREDEETLVVFASQAALVIANARRYRDEQRARADLETLIDTSPTGVVVFDGETGVPVFNREAARILENLLTPEQTPEQLLETLTVQRMDGRETFLQEVSVAQALSAGETLRAEEVVFQVPDGRRVTVLLSATPIRDEQGGMKSYVVTLQDMTPLEELDRLRAEFLDTLSHELRAPLASIKGSTATVLGASPVPPPDEMLQFFRIIDGQAGHMRSLISDLLDAANIKAGTLSVTPEPSEVTVLVDQARNTFLSGGSRHTVLIDLPLDLPRVMADPQRIVQVLNNLLANAARYSPESSVIRVDAALDGVDVEISVADEGRGVPPEQLPYLFQKYAGLGEEERGLPGTGLGLAICKGLVEAHGGRIGAASGGVGQGTRVTFSVPVAGEAGTGGAADGARPKARPGRERTRILVVDDDPQARRFMRGTLDEAGYDPIVTGNPQDLSHILRAEHPQLVLLDLLLPETDSIELMQSVPGLADRPVIFISAYGRDETMAWALETGASDYIVKPFSATELTARVRAALRRQVEPDPFVLGELAITYEQRHVTLAGQPVPLTGTEYQLLRVLSLNAGRVCEYDSLIRQVWGEANSGSRTLVRTFMKSLRRKLGEDAGQPTYIMTERGVGYRMAKPESRKTP